MFVTKLYKEWFLWICSTRFPLQGGGVGLASRRAVEEQLSVIIPSRIYFSDTDSSHPKSCPSRGSLYQMTDQEEVQGPNYFSPAQKVSDGHVSSAFSMGWAEPLGSILLLYFLFHVGDSKGFCLE